MWKWCVAFMLIGAVAGHYYIPVSRRQQLRESLEEQCTKYGNPDKIDQAETGVLTFRYCFSDIIDDKAYSEMFAERDEINERFITLAKSVCKSKSQNTKCLSDLFNSTVPCIDPELRSVIDDAKKPMQELASYICDNDAQIFTEFINDGALTCMERQASALKPFIRLIIALGNYRTTLSVAEACIYYNQLTTSIVGKLSECPKPSTAGFVSRIFHDLSKGFRCNSDTIKQIDEDEGSENAI